MDQKLSATLVTPTIGRQTDMSTNAMTKIEDDPPLHAVPFVDDADAQRQLHQRIAPELQALEATRRQRLFATRISAGLTVVACVAIGVVFGFANLQPDETPVGAILLGLLVGLVSAWVITRRSKKVFAGEATGMLMPAVCRWVGNLSFQRSPADNPDPYLFSKLLVVDEFDADLSHMEDAFAGTHHGISFRAVEARLRKRSRRASESGHTAFAGFDGLLLTIQVPVAFSGTILLAQDRGRLGNRLAEMFTSRRNYTAVPFDDSSFELYFEVYSDRVDEARRLLLPDLRRTLVDIARFFEGLSRRNYTRAAFHRGQLLIALPHRPDLFELGDLSQPMDRLQDKIAQLLWEVTIPHRVIDKLFGGPSGQMATPDVG